MENNKIDTIGYHYVVEVTGADSNILSDANLIRDIFLDAAKKAKMDVRASYFFKFSPQGVSGMIIISESHISIHTWPENQYAALDVYTCGESDPEQAVYYIIEKLKAKFSHISEIKRGIFDDDNTYTHMFLSWDEKIKKD